MGETKPGPKKKEWVRMTWENRFNGSVLTIESDDKRHCKEMFLTNVTDPKEWREKR
jgi:hypothetical protein